jgi:hypothetical protein
MRYVIVLSVGLMGLIHVRRLGQGRYPGWRWLGLICKQSSYSLRDDVLCCHKLFFHD